MANRKPIAKICEAMDDSRADQEEYCVPMCTISEAVTSTLRDCYFAEGTFQDGDAMRCLSGDSSLESQILDWTVVDSMAVEMDSTTTWQRPMALYGLDGSTLNESEERLHKTIPVKLRRSIITSCRTTDGRRDSRCEGLTLALGDSSQTSPGIAYFSWMDNRRHHRAIACKALGQLGHTQEPRSLWLDALCINHKRFDSHRLADLWISSSEIDCSRRPPRSRFMLRLMLQPELQERPLLLHLKESRGQRPQNKAHAEFSQVANEIDTSTDATSSPKDIPPWQLDRDYAGNSFRPCIVWNEAQRLPQGSYKSVCGNRTSTLIAPPGKVGHRSVLASFISVDTSFAVRMAAKITILLASACCLHVLRNYGHLKGLPSVSSVNIFGTGLVAFQVRAIECCLRHGYWS